MRCDLQVVFTKAFSFSDIHVYVYTSFHIISSLYMVRIIKCNTFAIPISDRIKIFPNLDICLQSGTTRPCQPFNSLIESNSGVGTPILGHGREVLQ